MRRGLLLIILIIAGLTRLYGLGADGFWFDEATTIMVAEKGLGSLIKLCSSDNVPPLYHLLLHFWLFAGRSEVWVRLLSVIFGLAVVYATWRLGNRLAGYPTGAFAALFIALSPINIVYSQEARMYAMVEFFVVASFSFLCAWAEEHRGRDLTGYFVCALAAIYTHLFSLFILLAQSIFVLFFLGISSRRKRQWLLCQGALLVLFVPWVIVVARQLNRMGEDFWFGRLSLRAFLSLWPYLGTGGDLGDNYVVTGLLNVPLIILLLFGFFTLLRRSPRAVAMVSTWLFIPIGLAGLLALFFPLWLNRYLLIVSPAYACAVGSALAAMRRKLQVLITLLVMLILAVSLHYQYAFVSRTQVKPAIDYIEDHYMTGDCIIHAVLKPERELSWKFDDEGWATFSYFPAIIYHRGRYPEFILTREKVPFYLRGELLAPGEVVFAFDEATAGYRRVWLVSWAKYDAGYGDAAARDLAGPDFHLVTSLRFPSPGNDTISLYLLKSTQEGEGGS